ncbi:hypothetical protein PQR57_35160 [Paraburkholderia dipogonis]|uniref:DUF4238 domain-containing protein n=1 Tax=Paraburkholderia dipogonis TaxID=1211383 RepID=A0ABW9B1N4_9BURK
MSDSGGRPAFGRRHIHGITAEHHSYGEHLCWHALHAVAGEHLASYPVIRRPYDEDDPWGQWLGRRVLTRSDGLWLADGTDLRPLETRINLREIRDEGVVLTGDQQKLLSLLGIENAVGEWLVVDGDWQSIDGISAYVQSALVPAKTSMKIATQLAKEDPFQAFLPRLEPYDDDGHGSVRSHAPFMPWVVHSNTEAGLDEPDSLGVAGAMQRARLSKTANAFRSLNCGDPFGRVWTDPSGEVIVRSDAWCQHPERGDGGRTSGTRLRCRSNFVGEFLAANKAHLLLLIVLRRYEAGFGDRPSQFWHTTAVAQLTESLDLVFHPGRTHELHKSEF